MHNKSEVSKLFIQCYNMLQTQFRKCNKKICFENDREYTNHNFSCFTRKHDITHDSYMSTYNIMVSHNENFHLLVSRIILFQMSAPKLHWDETILTDSYLITRVSSQIISVLVNVQFMISYFPFASIL